MQNLNERAMLVALSITTWTARKYDKKTTEKVAPTQCGRYNKNLFPEGAPSYKALIQACNAARTTHYTETLPWSDDGARILPASNYLEYTHKMRVHFREIDNAVSAFEADYPALKISAEQYLIKHGFTVSPDDYPDASELRDKFSHSTKVLPLPDKTDFRVELGDDELASIREAIEANVNASVNDAMRDLYQRLFDSVAHMAERLGQSDAIFRDSLVMNMRELCDVLPRLNLTNDANLDAMRERIETELATWEPEELRESKALRVEVARKADQIQKDLAAFMGA